MEDHINDALLRPPEPRVMPSYEPVQPYPAPYDAADGGALDASASPPQPRCRQYLSVAMAGLSVLTMGGLCFGFDSLYPILYATNAFSGACTDAERAACSARLSPLQREKCCSAQQSIFVALASGSLFAADGVFVVYGELTDRCGARLCMTIATALLWTGLSLLCAASSLQSDTLWALGLPLLGIAGPGVFMAVLSFGEAYPFLEPILTPLAASMFDGSANALPPSGIQAYPSLEPVLTPLAASMFDGSANVFLLWKLAFFAGAPLPAVAAAWLALTALTGVVTWWLLPPPSQNRSARASLSLRQSRSAQQERRLMAASASGALSPSAIEGSHRRPGSPSTLLSPLGVGSLNLLTASPKVLLLLFMALANLNQSFYMTTFQDQMLELLPHDEATSLVQTFDVAFPSLSMLTTPVAILLCSACTDREHLYMAAVTALTCLFGSLQLFPYASTQLAAVLAFGPARTLQWACYFHFFASPSRYPPHKMGRMVGYTNLFIALLGDGPPYLLTSFIRYALFPTTVGARYIAVHVGLQIVISALAVALPLHLAHSRSLRRQALLASSYRAAATAHHASFDGARPSPTSLAPPRGRASSRTLASSLAPPRISSFRGARSTNLPAIRVHLCPPGARGSCLDFPSPAGGSAPPTHAACPLPNPTDRPSALATPPSPVFNTEEAAGERRQEGRAEGGWGGPELGASSEDERSALAPASSRLAHSQRAYSRLGRSRLSAQRGSSRHRGGPRPGGDSGEAEGGGSGGEPDG